MHKINFLDVNDVILIHRNQIQLYGGGFSIRDMGLLESALSQPCSRFGGDYLHKFPFEMGSAYLFHLLQNHPFVDGNKRTGTTASLLFFTLNDIEIDPPLQALYEEVIAVAKGESNKSKLAEFFKQYAV